MKQVVSAARDLETWRTADLAEHPDVTIGVRQVFNVLEELAARGYVDRVHEGRGYTWYDDGLHRVNEYGDVEFDSADIDDVSDSTVDEIARSSSYTWEFCKPSQEPTESDVGAASTMAGDTLAPVNWTETPPKWVD